MKKVLLATTMLVAGASIAAADVTLSGDARMGFISNGSDDPTTANVDESALNFTSRARVTFTMSGESDSGLSFGASFRADNAAGAAAGTAGSVFISGAFGQLSAGDVDGAGQAATGHVAGVGLTGLGDLNESTFLSSGDSQFVTQTVGGGNVNPVDTRDPTFTYQYSFGDFTVFLSSTNPADVITDTNGAAAGGNVLTSNASTAAIGAKYKFGDYAVGLGYEKMSGFIAPAGPGVPVGGAAALDNTDLKHAVVTLEGSVAGVTVKGLYGKASGTLAGANIVAGGNNGKQYAASASYTTGAITGTIFYTDDSALGGTTAYGIGGAYDLGGGAVVQAGVVKDHDALAGAGSTAFDLGIALTF